MSQIELKSSDFTESNEPFRLFGEWLDDATKSEINDPNGVALATVDPDGLPNVRMVLLKGFDERGFVFYTNFESEKGREILASRKAAMCFHWKSLRRQVRVRGPVEIVSDAEADEYYATRPRGSRIGAWASKQSRPLESRFALEKAVAEYTAKYPDRRYTAPGVLVWLPHRAFVISNSGMIGRSACMTGLCSPAMAKAGQRRGFIRDPLFRNGTDSMRSFEIQRARRRTPRFDDRTRRSVRSCSTGTRRQRSIGLENAFGFVRSMVVTDDTGNLMHAEMRFADAYIIVDSEWAEHIASPSRSVARTPSRSYLRLARRHQMPIASGRGRRER